MVLEYSREDKKIVIVKYLYYGRGNVRGNLPFFQPMLSRTKPSAVSHKLPSKDKEMGQKAKPKLLIECLF